MAMSDVVNKTTAPAPAPAVAPVTAPAPATAPATAGNKGNSKSEAFKNQGAAIGATLSEEAKALEGSKSDKVEFIACLGDPSRKQKRTAKNQSVDSLAVVGYALRVLEDCEVPEAMIKPNFKALTDCEAPVMKPVKAGTTVYLNSFECGYFISQPQYAGSFTGNGSHVQFTVKWSNDRTDPLPILRKVGDGSIKEQMIEIADATTVDGKQIWKVKEGFEKFSALYNRKSAQRPGQKSAKVNGETQKNLARAFFAYVNEKNNG